MDCPPPPLSVSLLRIAFSLPPLDPSVLRLLLLAAAAPGSSPRLPPCIVFTFTQELVFSFFVYSPSVFARGAHPPDCTRGFVYKRQRVQGGRCCLCCWVLFLRSIERDGKGGWKRSEKRPSKTEGAVGAAAAINGWLLFDNIYTPPWLLVAAAAAPSPPPCRCGWRWGSVRWNVSTGSTRRPVPTKPPPPQTIPPPPPPTTTTTKNTHLEEEAPHARVRRAGDLEDARHEPRAARRRRGRPRGGAWGGGGRGRGGGVGGGGGGEGNGRFAGRAAPRVAGLEGADACRGCGFGCEGGWSWW